MEDKERHIREGSARNQSGVSRAGRTSTERSGAASSRPASGAGAVQNSRSAGGRTSSSSETSSRPASAAAQSSRPAGGRTSSSSAASSRPASAAARSSRPAGGRTSSSSAASNRPVSGVARNSGTAGDSQSTRRTARDAGEIGTSGAGRNGSRSRQKSASESRPKSAAEARARKQQADRRRVASRSDKRNEGEGLHRDSDVRKPHSSDRKMGRPIGVPLTGKSILVLAVIIGFILALIVSAVMRKNMLRVNQISEDYNLGDIFDINNFFEADSNDAVLSFDSSDFEPDKLGKCKIKFKVTRGKLSKTVTGSINIVDTDDPYIDGTDYIKASVGEEIDWSSYFNVIDNDPDINDKLEISPEVTTDKEKTVTVTLSVTDWAGNTSQKEVIVDVVESNF